MGKKSVEELKASLSKSKNNLQSSVATIAACEDKLVDLDKKITALRDERDKVSEQLKASQADKAKFEAEVAKLQKQIDDIAGQFRLNMGIDEVRSKLLVSALPVLDGQTLSELLGVNSSLESLKAPVSNGPAPAVKTPAVSASVPQPQANQGVSATAPKVKKWSKGAPKASGKMSVPLVDGAHMGLMFKSNMDTFRKNRVLLSINGEMFDIHEPVLMLRSAVTGDVIRSTVDNVRMFYVYAFICWLKQNGKDMSAESVFDYLVGCEYKDIGGMLIENYPPRAGKLVYYRLENDKGEVVKEVKSSTALTNVYEIYCDEFGNRILAGVLGCVTCPNCYSQVFKCYTGGSCESYRMEKCADISFSDIFKDSYLLFEEVVNA